MSIIQSAIGTLSGGNLVATFASNVTSGNSIVVFLTGNTNVNTITDTRSTSYTQKENVDDSATSGERIHGWIGVLGSGGANTVTVTGAGAFTDGAIIAIEISDLVGADPVGTRHANNTQAAPGTGANGVTCGPVTAVAGMLMLAVINVGALQTANYSAGTGFTEVAESGNPGANILDMAVYQKTVTAGSVSGTATSANNDRTISVLFSVEAAAVSGVPTDEPWMSALYTPLPVEPRTVVFS